MIKIPSQYRPRLLRKYTTRKGTRKSKKKHRTVYRILPEKAKPKKQKYYCGLCKHAHYTTSKIGKSHRHQARLRSEFQKTIQSYKKGKGKMFYCSLCKHRHRFSSKIGKLHSLKSVKS